MRNSLNRSRLMIVIMMAHIRRGWAKLVTLLSYSYNKLT